MKQKPWESKIPQNPKNKNRKRCYRIWTKITNSSRAGGKIVWLTDKQKTFYLVKYPNKIFEEELDKDTKEYYKKYLHQTVD
jgi:hypothetical protein